MVDRWKDVVSQYPELMQGLFVAQQVAFSGEQHLTDIMNKLWNQEFETEEEVFAHRVLVTGMVGLVEMKKRLELNSDCMSEEFESYYQLVK